MAVNRWYFWQLSQWPSRRPSRRVVWQRNRQLFKNCQKSIVLQCFLGWQTVKTGRMAGDAVTTAVKKGVLFFYSGLFTYLLHCWYLFSPLCFHITSVLPLRHASETDKKWNDMQSQRIWLFARVPDAVLRADKERVSTLISLYQHYDFMGLSKQKLQKHKQEKSC